MLTLLDNTLLHRVGKVLESPPGGVVLPVDLLAIFHLVEHILFSDRLLVSTFQSSATQERTATIIAALSTQGIASPTAVTHEKFTLTEYAAACEAASWAILEELSNVSPEDLRRVGRLADAASRPSGMQPAPFHVWCSPNFDHASVSPDDLEYFAMRGEGVFRYTILINAALRTRIRELNHEAAVLDTDQAGALTALFRLKINQELARLRLALYSPAPQRARLSFHWNELFRHQLERAVAEAVAARKSGSTALLRTLARLDSLPLPALAIHFLRDAPTRSPEALIEAASQLRERRDVVEARRWLSAWEAKMRSNDASEKLEALSRLDTWTSEIRRIVSPEDASVVASIRPGIKAELDQATGNPTFSADLGGLGELLARLWRRLDKQRKFLAVISTEMATDDALGSFLLRSVNRTL